MTVDDLNLGGVKAWVRWDSSSGSPVIVDDYNIVSGSDGGTGKVTWTFERPFRNYNYAFDGMTCNNPATSTTTGTHKIIQNGAQSATQFGTRANQDSGSPVVYGDCEITTSIRLGYKDEIYPDKAGLIRFTSI